MSDGPRDGGDEQAAPGSAPWERPRRWNSQRLDATRVDDLLARLGDDGPRRGRRRAADDAVPAGELIAALQNAQSSADVAAADPDTTVGLGDEEPAGADTAAPAPDGGDDATVVIRPGTVPAPAPAVIRGPARTTEGASAPVGVPPVVPVVAAAPPAPLVPAGVGAAPPVTSAAPPARAAAPAAPAAPMPPVDQAIAVGAPQHKPFPHDADEATVLIPRYSDSAAAILESLNRNAAGAPPIIPPTTTGDSGSGGHRPPPRSNTTRGFLYAGRSIVALLAVALMAISGYEWNLLRTTNEGLRERQIVDSIQTQDTNISTATKAKPPVVAGGGGSSQVYDAENILLLGSDTRAGDNGNPGNSDQSTEGVANSDTMMVAHISADRQHVTIVSFPRDLRVDAPLCKTWNSDTRKVGDKDWTIEPGERWKINSTYSVGGPACTVKAVQQLTGLRIDRIIEVDFVGFQTMVDALGGIKINICKPIVDKVLNTVVPTAGEQTIRGEQAINLVRAREVVGDPTGDFGRIRRQQMVLSALLRQAVSAGTILNPVKLKAFLEAFVKSTYTANVTVDSMLQLAKSFGNLDPSRITFYTLPTVPIAGDSQDGQDLDPKAQAVFNALINDETLPGEPATPTSSTALTATTGSAGTSAAPPTTGSAAPQKLTVAPKDVDLEVVNVAGRPGVAGEGQTLLNGIGFDISDDDLTLPPDSPVYEPTTVLYAPANRAAALTVAAAVPGAVLETQADLGNHVRLLLGSSFDGKVQAVKVGDAVPASLATAVADTGTSGTATPGTGASTAGSNAAGSATKATKPAPTLGSTDLSSVNAGSTSCA